MNDSPSISVGTLLAMGVLGLGCAGVIGIPGIAAIGVGAAYYANPPEPEVPVIVTSARAPAPAPTGRPAPTVVEPPTPAPAAPAPTVVAPRVQVSTGVVPDIEATIEEIDATVDAIDATVAVDEVSAVDHGQIEVKALSGVKILLDGKLMRYDLLKSTFMDRKVSPGEHLLEVQNLLGKVTHSETVTVKAGKRMRFQHRSRSLESLDAVDFGPRG